MNTGIYDIIKNQGLNLHSPTLDHLSTSIAALNSAHAKVGALPVAVPPLPVGFPQETITAIQTAISNAKSSLESTKGATSNRMNNVFTDIVYNSQSGSVEGAQGCGSLPLLTGSFSGAMDDDVNDVTALANSIIENVEAFILGTIDQEALTAIMGAFQSSVQPFLDALDTIQAKEEALLNEMKKVVESASMTQTIENLWKDPCAQAVLGPLLPNSIKDLL